MNRYAPLKPKGVAFSPDGSLVAIAYGPNAQLNAHRELTGFEVHCAEDVNFLPDGSHLVITDQAQDRATVVSFDRSRGTIGPGKVIVRNPAAQLSFPHGNGVSPDGRYIAVANYGDDKVTLYELDPARLPRGVHGR